MIEYILIQDNSIIHDDDGDDDDDDGNGDHLMYSFFFSDRDDMVERSSSRFSIDRGSDGEERDENSLSLPLQMRVHILSGQELDRIIRERSMQVLFIQICIDSHHQTLTLSTTFIFICLLIGRRFRQRVEHQFQLQARGYTYREGRLVISLISNALASVMLYPRK